MQLPSTKAESIIVPTRASFLLITLASLRISLTALTDAPKIILEYRTTDLERGLIQMISAGRYPVSE